MFIIGISTFSELILVVFSLLLLLKESPTKRANRFLAMAFISMAVLNVLLLYLYYARSQKSDFLLSFYLPLGMPVVMLIGPALYFYLALIFNGSKLIPFKTIGTHALAALPALTYVIYFATLPAQKRIAMLMSDSFSTDWMVSLLNGLFYIQSGIYLSVCFRKVNKQRKQDYILKGNGQQTNIRWLHYFFIFVLTGLCIYIPVCSIPGLNQIRILAGMSIIDMLIIYILIESVWQTGLSMQQLSKELPKVEHKLVIKDELAENYLLKLQEVMVSSKIYLSKDCSLKDVALRADIPLHHLSTLINSCLNKNFPDFRNEYRISYACRLICDVRSRNLTLEAIGYECGFKSRVNFHRAFKKFTGKTPAEFQADQERMANPAS